MRRMKVGNMSKGFSLPGFERNIVNKDEGYREKSKFRGKTKSGQ